MPLLDLWRSNPDAVAQFRIEQVVSAAGDGHLTDESTCARELREYLRTVPSDKVFEYAARCLDGGFQKSGGVLQDLVNELGRRLDYAVEHGLYQGKVNAIGFDGIWVGPDGHSLVVEVKTTDAYRINLDTLAGYRSALIARSRIRAESSVLIVVGRQDTGDIEAQIRGSRHAWDVRIISVEALQRLVVLKESSEEDETLQKIRSLLVPFEYTRLDNIIDVIFTTARDVEAAADAETDEVDPAGQGDEADVVQRHTPTHVLQLVRSRVLVAIATKHGAQLVAHKRALYWSADRSLRVACSVSKYYERNGYYWYAYHPAWDQVLVYQSWDRRADLG